jgi:hypothetical protein
MYVEQPGDMLIAALALGVFVVIFGQMAWEAIVATRINWNRTGVNQFATAKPQKGGGFTATIVYSTDYLLTISGPGAPAATHHPTLLAAKNAFRKFTLSQS